jgi:glycosyltransferase involved in cell wall biosynthesis
MSASAYIPVSRLVANETRPDIALFLPTLYSGGAERVQLNLARYFLDRGLRVDLVVCKYFGSLKDQVPSGVRLISLDAHKVMFSVPAYLRYLRIARPSVVLSSVENAAIVSCVGKMLSSHRHRLLVRLDNSLSEPGVLPLQLHRWPVMTAVVSTFHAADAFVAVSNGLKEQLSRLPGLGKKPIRRIYNPIIHEGFEAQAGLTPALPPSIRPGEPFVLAAGRLHKQKGYTHLLLAFARVAQQRSSHLVILGEGDDREELQALARSLGIAPYVHFIGYASNPLAYMRHAAVFVLSSLAEGFGNVIVEALACGTPVISTDCPHGPREILSGGRYGTLVPVGDVDSLAQAIVAKLNAPKPAMSEELKEHLQLFSIETIGRRYLEDLELPSVTISQSAQIRTSVA